jgi:hypothetical protein
MGLGSTVLDLPATPVNARAFGRPGTARAPAAFPPLRSLARCELGTHAICGLSIKPCRNEQILVPALLDLLGLGMLLLWDRGFFGYDSFRRVLVRESLAGPRPDPVDPHPRPALGRRLLPGQVVPLCGIASPGPRGGNDPGVIGYTHDDPHRPGYGERHRLITDLLNPADLPAAEAPSSTTSAGRRRRPKQTTHQGGGGSAPHASAIIDVTALLELAAWCRQRLDPFPLSGVGQVWRETERGRGHP